MEMEMESVEETDAASDAALSGSSESNRPDNNSLNSRRLAAMGEAMSRLSQQGQISDAVDSQPIGLGWEQDLARNAADMQSMSIDAQILMNELAALMDGDRICTLSQVDLECRFKETDIIRAKEILGSNSEVDVNIKVLPNGETFLSGSVSHSVGMVKVMLEHGADPNLENDMANETAYDKVEEYLEDFGSPELEEMKQLLLDKGAVCFEDRMARLGT
jgi:hypothetical protein